MTSDHYTYMAPWRQWGTDLDPGAIEQMKNACRLPVAIRGALMPDAHTGYGMPIGGVLATQEAIIPFAVGMDIACRMKLTVFDMPIDALTKERDKLIDALEKETCFGIGNGFQPRKQHKVMDEDWSVSPVTSQFKDKAWHQLGSSGSGNHFCEFGILTVRSRDLGLDTGLYMALLTHGGSRGTGAEVATYYSKLAKRKRPDLPHEMADLAWLNLQSHEGQEYWAAMELMGKYAAANHELIHEAIARHLDVSALLGIENHHNFAWRETLADGQKIIVHRKGATPAGKGAIGVIPGSMATPAYVVRGKGNDESLNSAAHGAGRKMSRAAAKRQFSRQDMNAYLEKQGVELLSADLDEIPMAYKNIDRVMAAQADLVEIMAKFEPKLVKMAPPERFRHGRR
ncbi:MAG: RtcB family protein [Lentisphaerae bacterium]|nr:RtcB family protein [Lentisphaerota bacterium]